MFCVDAKSINPPERVAASNPFYVKITPVNIVTGERPGSSAYP